LRGSGRFGRCQLGAATRRGFNPLHCGAVVASRRALGRWRDRRFQSPSLRGSGRFVDASSASRQTRFNPLHCGAVVASGVAGRSDATRDVSIPFIAGQWSLHSPLPRSGGHADVSIPFIAGQWSLRREAAVGVRTPAFQSPSLRGSGRFRPRATWRAVGSGSFNPLHCGAVVASRRLAAGGRKRRVSIPFIAGQWSLRRRRATWRSPASFNPLHCGAVVASGARRERASRCAVSIPFIAGQWSLPWRTTPCILDGFQSPSLRGSGRFARGRAAADGACFNPLHCGAVVASAAGALRAGEREFQSPSLRGSGRFAGRRAGERPAVRFQSPSLRGSGRFRAARRSTRSQRVSIPFIAGQWSLLPRTTPLSFCGVLLRKRRLPCDHVLCTRLPF
jgi:hypothetical protein